MSTKRCLIFLLLISFTLSTSPVSAEIIEIGAIDTPGDTNDVVVVGDFAYVADNQAGLRIINISSPEEPVEVIFFYTPNTTLYVTIQPIINPNIYINVKSTS
jgi:hypothetical protein